jgi:plastocyanin
MYKKFLFSLLGLTLLTIMFSACRIVDASTIPQNPKVHMGTSNFIDTTISIKKGQSIDLVDTVASHHVIANGQWSASNQQEPAKEASAPDASLTFDNSGQSQTVGPFNASGTYHIYCSVHPGMNLTVTVS